MIKPEQRHYDFFRAYRVPYEFEFDGFELTNELGSWKDLQKEIRAERARVANKIEELEEEIRDLQEELNDHDPILVEVGKKICQVKIRLGIIPCEGQLPLFGGVKDE